MFSKLVILLAAPAILAAQTTPAGFRPISLAEAIRLTKENNVQVIQSANAIRQASNTARSARAQLYPTLSVNAGQSKSAGQRPGQTGDLVPYTSAWSYNTGASAGFILFDARAFSDIKRTQAMVVNAETDRLVTETNLEFQVKTQYNAVLREVESENAARAQLASAQQNLAVSVAKVNAGAATVADSLTAVVQVGNAEISILTSQQQMRTASLALTRLVGTSELVTAILGDTTDFRISPIDSAALMSMVLESPVVRQFETQLVADQAARKVARAAYLPTIGASLGFGGNGTKNIYGLGGENPYAYNRSLGISARYDIFNRFTRENGVVNAQIALENTQAQLRDNKFGAQQTILTQLGVIRNAEAQIRVYGINVRASEEALRLIQARYQAGAATILEVLQAQQALNTARNQLIGARFTYRNARAAIEQQIGRNLP
jgi:outer membrane protein TolC